MTSRLRRRLAHLELVASAAARPPAFVRYLLPDGTMDTVTNMPPGVRFILGIREAESVEAWQKQYSPPEQTPGLPMNGGAMAERVYCPVYIVARTFQRAGSLDTGDTIDMQGLASRYALAPFGQEDAYYGRLWKHSDVFPDPLKEEPQAPDQAAVEEAAGRYLEHPWMSVGHLDWSLANALTPAKFSLR